MATETGIQLIAKEREEQLTKHGRSADYDRGLNKHYQLSNAAALLTWVDEEEYRDDVDAVCPEDWDPELWRKMMQKPYKERLIIAGALLAAEIDRIQAFLRRH